MNITLFKFHAGEMRDWIKAPGGIGIVSTERHQPPRLKPRLKQPCAWGKLKG